MNKKTDDLFKILENGENIGEYFSENIEEIIPIAYRKFWLIF